METLTKSVIVTRYNEHIDWIDYIQNDIDIFYIYNKGENNRLFKNLVPSESLEKKLNIKVLPNIGRIDHTLAYHITQHWDSLEETIVSLPASILMCRLKGSYLSAIKKRLLVVKNRYYGFYSPRFHKVGPQFNY